MKKHILGFLKIVVPLTIVLCSLQYLLVARFFTSFDFQFSTLAIYTFHFVVALLIYLFLLFVSKTFFENTGYAFMACSLLKMLASVVFLWPLIGKEGSVIHDVVAFFVPYFIYLTVEVIYVVKLMQGGKK